MKTLRDQSFSATRWTTFAMGTRAATALLQTIILARILGPSEFGTIALAVMVTGVSTAIADLGVNSAIMHFRSVSDKELSSLYWLNVTTGALLSLIVLSVAPLISHIYDDPALLPVLEVAALSVFLGSIGQQFKLLAERDINFMPVAIIEIAAALGGFIVAVSCALVGLGALSIAIALAFSAACQTILNVVFLSKQRLPSFHFSYLDVKRFIYFGFGNVLTNLVNTLTLQGDVIASGASLTKTELGLYSQPRELCLRFMFVVNPIITRVGFPIMAKVQHDPDALRLIYLASLRMTASINFPFYIFVAMFNEEIIQVVLGQKWADSSVILRYVAIWCLFRSIGNPIGSLLTATGNVRSGLWSSIAMLCGVFIASLIGSRWGPVGIPVSLAILYCASLFPIYLFIIRPVIHCPFFTYFQQLFSPLLTALIAGILAEIGRVVLPPGVIGLFFTSFLFAFAYCVISLRTNREWVLAMLRLIGLHKKAGAAG